MNFQIKAQVDRLFRQAPDRHEEIRTNPVTGGRWVNRLDPVKPQKQAALRALMAGDWFARTAPPGAPPLPLSYEEREALKRGGLPHIVAWFARSLDARRYAYDEHPSIEDYACGVMASPHAPDFITQDPELLKHYPPRPLRGLDPHLYWDPPKRPRCRRRRSG